MSAISPHSHLMHRRGLDMFLKNPWHFTRTCIECGDSTPFPSYVYITFTHPIITRRVFKESDIAAHVTRRCVGALVVNNLAAHINARALPANDAELACLSAILTTDNQDVTHLLSHPGTIQFTNLMFLIHDINDSWGRTSPHVLDMVLQTFRILSQALPAQLDAEMQLDLTDALAEVSKGQFEPIL